MGRAGFFCFPAVGIIGRAGVAAVAARSLPGGTSPERVAEQLQALDLRIADARAFADAR